MAKKRKVQSTTQQQETELRDVAPVQEAPPDAAAVVVTGEETLPDAEETPLVSLDVTEPQFASVEAGLDGAASAVVVDGNGKAISEDAIPVEDTADQVVEPPAVCSGGELVVPLDAGDKDASKTALAIAGDGVLPDGATAVAKVEEDDEPEPLENLLEPLSKEQLISLLCQAAERHADIVEHVQLIADQDPVHRKIFVHGLGWDTTADTLASFYRQYGEIDDLNVVCDKVTGKSKGYGFILFKHRSGARRAVKQPQKKIGNRMTACQMASTGPVPAPTPLMSDYTQRKIYVSNVSAELDPHKLLQFFAKYGEIEEGPLGLDKQTGKPRGFALFVYKSVDSARRALEEPHKNFEGHILHCQKAIDGPKLNKPGFFTQYSGSPVYPGAASGAQTSHFTRSELGNFGHLMAPSAPSVGATPGINPAVGQALASLLTTSGTGLGLNNLLGQLGASGITASVSNQAMPGSIMNSATRGMHSAYGNQVGAAGNVNSSFLGTGQTSVQGGYGSASMNQGTVHGQKVSGYKGGVSPYPRH